MGAKSGVNYPALAAGTLATRRGADPVRDTREADALRWLLRNGHGDIAAILGLAGPGVSRG